MKFTIKDIIGCTGAQTLHGCDIEGNNAEFSICTDTRKLTAGDIYLPLRGENYDGHNFIDKAIELGAAGYLTQDSHKVNKSAAFVLCVKNTLVAYLQIAKLAREKIDPKIVAITGSSGKTTVKEMLYCVLSTTFKTHKSFLNHNNEIGLCETMLQMPENTEAAVVEMGMRNLGEIELLSNYCLPNFAIITNVGSAHLEKLGTLENIATAKCEIRAGLHPEGYLVAQNSELIKARLKDGVKSIYVSISDAQNVEISAGVSKFTFEGDDFTLSIEGEHNVENAMQVIVIAKKLGVSVENIKKGLLDFKPIEKRWEISSINGFTLINDSYNANPESMQAVIKTFLSVYNAENAPVMLVLGDMLELGKDEIKYHKELGEFLSSYKGVKLLTFGVLAKFISKNTLIESEHFEDKKELAQRLASEAKSGMSVLLKASRSMKFEEIVEMVKNMTGGAQ
jgi:UDP-N-acetylmuramoyl-tripeptide--D-alanyl-D-alanine ligase